MTSNAQAIMDHLARSGVTAFFGVQGGASAHLIDAACLHDKTQYIPVMNEQAAGLAAHGHFMATGHPGGALVTTGPGFFNLVTGIAACYYDNVPSIFLCGQVNQDLNLAREFGTKMYGFQEAPHAEIAEYIADTCLKVRNDNELADALAAISRLHMPEANGPLVLEIQDDYQRQPFAVHLNNLPEADVTAQATLPDGVDAIVAALQASERPVLAIGAGVSRIDSAAAERIDTISKTHDIPVVFSWGGQRLRNNTNANHVGLFGCHCPGVGNSLIQNADLVIGVGVSLLQHQAGKAKDLFAPDAKMFVINRDTKETPRYVHDFGDRIHVVGADSARFLEHLDLALNESKRNTPFWPDIQADEKRKKWSMNVTPSVRQDVTTHDAVASLTSILSACPSDYWVFSDAGATLSWTYQAVSECDAPPVSTSFNLHTMGYALPAAIGAAAGNGRSGILSISGDGGFMMNIQELAVAQNMSTPIKVLLIDNRGYGIIRQTQKAFLGQRYFGSDMGDFPSLPPYQLKALTEAFGFETRDGGPKDADDLAAWLFETGSGHRTAIIRIDEALEVEHTTPNYKPLVY